MKKREFKPGCFCYHGIKVHREVCLMRLTQHVDVYIFSGDTWLFSLQTDIKAVWNFSQRSAIAPLVVLTHICMFTLLT